MEFYIFLNSIQSDMHIFYLAGCKDATDRIFSINKYYIYF